MNLQLTFFFFFQITVLRQWCLISYLACDPKGWLLFLHLSVWTGSACRHSSRTWVRLIFWMLDQKKQLGQQELMRPRLNHQADRISGSQSFESTEAATDAQLQQKDVLPREPPVFDSQRWSTCAVISMWNRGEPITRKWSKMTEWWRKLWITCLVESRPLVILKTWHMLELLRVDHFSSVEKVLGTIVFWTI